MSAAILRNFRNFVRGEGNLSYLSYLRSGYHAYIFRIFRNSSYFTKILYFVFFVIPPWPKSSYPDEHTKNTNNSETSIDSQAIPSLRKIAHGQARRCGMEFRALSRYKSHYKDSVKNPNSNGISGERLVSDHRCRERERAQ